MLVRARKHAVRGELGRNTKGTDRVHVGGHDGDALPHELGVLEDKLARQGDLGAALERAALGADLQTETWTGRKSVSAGKEHAVLH